MFNYAEAKWYPKSLKLNVNRFTCFVCCYGMRWHFLFFFISFLYHHWFLHTYMYICSSEIVSGQYESDDQPSGISSSCRWALLTAIDSLYLSFYSFYSLAFLYSLIVFEFFISSGRDVTLIAVRFSTWDLRPNQIFAIAGCLFIESLRIVMVNMPEL